MNKTFSIIVVVVVIAGGIYLATRPHTQVATNTQQTQNTPVTTHGTVVYSVTDGATNMGAVTEIDLTASKVEMHSAVNGWITVSNTPQTFNLLELNAKNETKLLANASAPTGTYDQVRLSVDSVIVKTKDGKTTTAKVPSNMLTINTTVVVKDGATSSVHFDFLASKSLHMTGNGGYIFAPVVKIETKSNADVKIDSEDRITFGGGNIDDDEDVGMDIDGSTKSDFELDENSKYDVIDNTIRLHDDLNTTLRTGINSKDN